MFILKGESSAASAMDDAQLRRVGPGVFLGSPRTFEWVWQAPAACTRH